MCSSDLRRTVLVAEDVDSNFLLLKTLLGKRCNLLWAKDAAFDALLVWKGFDAADALFAICKENPSAEVFDKALKRYVQLVSNPSFTGENRLLNLRNAMEIAKTNEQKVIILKEIQKTGTFLALMYARSEEHTSELQSHA